MLNRYTLSSFFWIGTLFYYPLAFCGPLSLAPTPLIHNIIADRLFAKELINKQPSLLKVEKSYPNMIVGGHVEAQLVDRLSTNENQTIDKILVHTLLCLDHNVMLMMPFSFNKAKADQSSGSFFFKEFAFVLGRHSKQNLQTDIGNLKLPFRIYGAIGRFLSPIQPLRSEVFNFKSAIPLIKEVLHRSPLSTSSFLVGIQREYGLHSFNIELSALNLNEIFVKSTAISANAEYVFSNREYQFRGGSGYDNRYLRGLAYGSILHNHYKLTLSFQQMFGEWLMQKNSGTSSSKWVKHSPGYLELNWDCRLPIWHAPAKLAVGYSWLHRLRIPKRNGQILSGGMLITITNHINLAINTRLNALNWALNGFNVRLVVNF